MATPHLRVVCPQDGETDVWAREVTLTVAGPEAGIYGFRCPVCGVWREKPANKAIMDLIRTSEAKVIEPVSPEPHPENAPPLTSDDLLDLHEQLKTL